MEWQPLAPKLVVEVESDHFTGGRFRHGTKFVRWRPEKAPQDCTMEQVNARIAPRWDCCELARQGSAFADQQAMAAHEHSGEGQNGGHEA